MECNKILTTLNRARKYFEELKKTLGREKNEKRRLHYF